MIQELDKIYDVDLDDTGVVLKVTPSVVVIWWSGLGQGGTPLDTAEASIADGSWVKVNHDIDVVDPRQVEEAKRKKKRKKRKKKKSWYVGGGWSLIGGPATDAGGASDGGGMAMGENNATRPAKPGAKPKEKSPTFESYEQLVKRANSHPVIGPIMPDDDFQEMLETQDWLANENGTYDYSSLHQVLIAVDKIPQEYMAKVDQFLGAGAYSMAWALNNGYVLKLGFDPNGEARKFLSQAKDRMFDKTATKQTLNVLDVQSLSENMFFAVISRLNIAPGKLQTSRVRDVVMALINSGEDVYTMSKQKFISAAIKKWNEYSPDASDENMSLAAKKKLLSAAWDILSTSTHRPEIEWDLHGGNYGMLPNDPDTPVFFDPVAEAVHELELEYLRAKSVHAKLLIQ